jgi:hypothetical protein
MDYPKILGIGTAVPDSRYSQQALAEEVLAPYLATNPHTKTIFQNAGIGFRHLVVEPDYYEQERRTQ